MNLWVALLRGVNVVGANRLPMNDLATLLADSGCSDVRTYIQSGNVVFRSRLSVAGRVERRIAEAIGERHGFQPRVLALTLRELEKAAAGNPFPQARRDPKSVHLFFLATPPKRPDLAGLEALRARSERFELKDRVLYLHTPDGFGTSKLAARAERLLGVAATARNWRTVSTLLDMARES